MIKTVAPVCLAVLFASTVMADSGDTPHALVLSAALARATASPLLAIDQNRVTVVDRIVAQWGEALSRSDAGVGSEQLRHGKVRGVCAMPSPVCLRGRALRGRYRGA